MIRKVYNSENCGCGGCVVR
ncbi:MAG: hypothetical protein EBX50_14455 [Chitinophagia bacterium]|nr:hypothetical protein [Chitinophagia bacterium]